MLFITVSLGPDSFQTCTLAYSDVKCICLMSQILHKNSLHNDADPSHFHSFRDVGLFSKRNVKAEIYSSIFSTSVATYWTRNPLERLWNVRNVVQMPLLVGYIWMWGSSAVQLLEKVLKAGRSIFTKRIVLYTICIWDYSSYKEVGIVWSCFTCFIGSACYGSYESRATEDWTCFICSSTISTC